MSTFEQTRRPLCAYCNHGLAQGESDFGIADGGALTSAHREKGLLIGGVSPHLPEHLGGRMRKREKQAISRFRTYNRVLLIPI